MGISSVSSLLQSSPILPTAARLIFLNAGLIASLLPKNIHWLPIDYELSANSSCSVVQMLLYNLNYHYSLFISQCSSQMELGACLQNALYFPASKACLCSLYFLEFPPLQVLPVKTLSIFPRPLSNVISSIKLTPFPTIWHHLLQGVLLETCMPQLQQASMPFNE